MIDLWVEDLETGESFRVTRDKTKPIYIKDDGSTEIDLQNISRYRFFPCCPRKAPTFSEVQEDYQQMSIFDYEV